MKVGAVFANDCHTPACQWLPQLFPPSANPRAHSLVFTCTRRAFPKEIVQSISVRLSSTLSRRYDSSRMTHQYDSSSSRIAQPCRLLSLPPALCLSFSPRVADVLSRKRRHNIPLCTRAYTPVNTF